MSMECGLTQAGVVGEHALQSQTVLPLVAAAFTVAPQRHVCRAVTDVVGCHDGTYKSGGSKFIDKSKLWTCQRSYIFNLSQYFRDINMFSRNKHCHGQQDCQSLLASTLHFTLSRLAGNQINCFMAQNRKRVQFFNFKLS